MKRRIEEHGHHALIEFDLFVLRQGRRIPAVSRQRLFGRGADRGLHRLGVAVRELQHERHVARHRQQRVEKRDEGHRA